MTRERGRGQPTTESSGNARHTNAVFTPVRQPPKRTERPSQETLQTATTDQRRRAGGKEKEKKRWKGNGKRLGNGKLTALSRLQTRPSCLLRDLRCQDVVDHVQHEVHTSPSCRGSWSTFPLPM